MASKHPSTWDAATLAIQALNSRRDVFGLKHALTRQSRFECLRSLRRAGKKIEAGIVEMELRGLQRDIIGFDHPQATWMTAVFALLYKYDWINGRPYKGSNYRD